MSVIEAVEAAAGIIFGLAFCVISVIITTLIAVAVLQWVEVL